MHRRSQLRFTLALAAVIAALSPLARGAEHITLRNGFELDCARRETTGDRVRLYLLPAPASNGQPTAEAANYIEVPASAVLRAETIPDPAPATKSSAAEPGAPEPALSLSKEPALSLPKGSTASASPLGEQPSASTPAPIPAQMREMLARAGTRHNIDADLLAAVVYAESGGRVRAVSRAGAQGLMQLMPTTAFGLGVRDSFAPEENISGGTAYLDQLLARYHDDVALALAAYNAGPAAVDRYHGIPPYAETRAYVARVIREFNRRKTTSLASAK
jgi:soluble lytic murein transglycosylase-like protein